MIAMIEHERYNYKLNLPTTLYEFVECENIEDVKQLSKYKDNQKINYIGEILRKSQRENLMYYGNTVISYTMLEKLGNTKIIQEVKRITGLNCGITVLASGTVMLKTVKM
jgi:hypothetical protein